MIGISLLTFALGRMGGSEVYVRALTAALARVGTHEYFVIAPPDAEDAAGGLRIVTAGALSRAGRVRAMTRAGAAFSSLRGAEVVHYPLTVPLPHARRPRVVTLHDVLHRDHPTLVSRSTRAFRAVAYDRAARGSNLVIVPSEFVRDRAVATIGLDPKRIRVVHHGVDHSIFHSGSESRKPFLLYPARFWPHKNHARLFEAFTLVRRDRPELELVLSGGGHVAQQLPVGVRSVGLVPARDLADLYRSAQAMVFPSLYEGFGSPVLEAMACGCPVATSTAASLPEVAGDAAVLFDATSPREIAAGILRALESADRLAALGIERAGAFTWEASAVAHDEAYGELLESS